MGCWAFLVAQTVKTLPAMQVQSLDWKDPLEKGMADHSSILAWRIHGQRSLVAYSPWSPWSQTPLTNTFTLSHGSW